MPTAMARLATSCSGAAGYLDRHRHLQHSSSYLRTRPVAVGGPAWSDTLWGEDLLGSAISSIPRTSSSEPEGWYSPSRHRGPVGS